MTRVLWYRYLLSLSFYRSITVQSFSIQHAYYDNHVTNNNRIPVTFSSSLLLLLQASSGASDDNNNSSNQNDDNEDHNDNDDDDDICWHPCSIEISNLSHQYPVTLWRTLTSSEPRREFALQDVSLKLGPHEFVLLLGDSSSGKSTLLRLILGLEERKIVLPTFGTIQIAVVVPYYSKEEEDDDDSATEILPPPAAVPVLLDQKPVYSNNRGSQTVQMILQEKLKKMNKASTIIQHHDEKSSQTTLFLIIERLCELMDLPLTKKGSDLSPSEAYRCAMTEASLESILTGKAAAAAAAAVNDDDDRDETSKTISSFPAPILLLDEWLDKETSTVVQNVQTSILKLVQTSGAIVVSITHKPNLYKQSIKEEGEGGEESSSHVRSITLCRGKVVA